MGTPRAREEAFYEILAERLSVGVPDDENAMDRGNRLEDEAIAWFEMETGKSVEKLGFAEDDTNPMIANSPDGIIGDTEAVEVKCPGGKNFVKMWLTNKVPEEYFWQVVQYFIVNQDLKVLWFVGYNPDIPVHPFHLITVLREDVQVDIDRARVSQEEFIKEVNEKLATLIEEI